MASGWTLSLGCGSPGMPAGLFQPDTTTVFCWAAAGADRTRVWAARQVPRIYPYSPPVAAGGPQRGSAAWPWCSGLLLVVKCGPVGRIRRWLPLSACLVAATSWRKRNSPTSSCSRCCCWVSSPISARRPSCCCCWPRRVVGCRAPAAASGSHGQRRTRRPAAQPRRPCFAVGRGTTC